MIKARIRYERGDEVKFISHLDILKLFERAARRCDLPLAYTEGFNPRPRLVFGNPLPVGVTSECEYVDIYLTKDLSADELKDMLNNVMPKGVQMLEVFEIKDKEENIMASVTSSEYILDVNITKEDADKIIDTFNSGKSLFVEKKSKSGTKNTDIRPMIRSLQIKDNKIIIVTDAGNVSNLRPELAISALNEHSGANVEVLRIHRTKLL